jgi:hypothetical protein
MNAQTRTWRLQGPDDIDKTFAEIVTEGFGALYVTSRPSRGSTGGRSWISLLDTGCRPSTRT